MKRSLGFLVLFSLSVVVLSSCSGGKKEEASSTSPEATAPAISKPQFVVDAVFQEQLGGVFAAYVLMKDAFVSSDAAQVKTAAAKVQQVLSNVDMKLVSGAAHHDWMTYLSSLESSLKEIQVTDNLAAQRKAFSALSDNLYKTIKAFGLGGVTAYYEFCPMAFDNVGGYWLSDSDSIRNPYFGDEMLTCGMVKETLQ